MNSWHIRWKSFHIDFLYIIVLAMSNGNQDSSVEKLFNELACPLANAYLPND